MVLLKMWALAIVCDWVVGGFDVHAFEPGCALQGPGCIDEDVARKWSGRFGFAGRLSLVVVERDFALGHHHTATNVGHDAYNRVVWSLCSVTGMHRVKADGNVVLLSQQLRLGR